MKIRIVNTLRTDWLYGVRIKSSIDTIVSVLGTYMTSSYICLYAYMLIIIS